MAWLKKLAGGGAHPQKDPNSLVGRVVSCSQFTLLCEESIGVGGYASIYRVRDQATNTIYALKHMRLSQDSDAVAEVRQEMRVMHLLGSHPNILKLLAASFAGPAGKETDAFMVLDFCPITLLDMMQRSNFQLDEFFVHEVFSEVCHAVAHMHTFNPPYAHRDIKAENVLKTAKGKWVLCDFGSSTTKAQVFETPAEIAMEEEVIRRTTTPAYRAPEMWDLMGRQRIDTKVDIWALGVLLYVLVFGKLPFQGDSKLSILFGKYEMPQGKPQVFCDLIRDMLATDPAARPDILTVIGRLDVVKQALLAAINGDVTPPQPAAPPAAPAPAAPAPQAPHGPMAASRPAQAAAAVTAAAVRARPASAVHPVQQQQQPPMQQQQQRQSVAAVAGGTALQQQRVPQGQGHVATTTAAPAPGVYPPVPGAAMHVQAAAAGHQAQAHQPWPAAPGVAAAAAAAAAAGRRPGAPSPTQDPSKLQAAPSFSQLSASKPDASRAAHAPSATAAAPPPAASAAAAARHGGGISPALLPPPPAATRVTASSAAQGTLIEVDNSPTQGGVRVTNSFLGEGFSPVKTPGGAVAGAPASTQQQHQQQGRQAPQPQGHHGRSASLSQQEPGFPDDGFVFGADAVSDGQVDGQAGRQGQRSQHHQGAAGAQQHHAHAASITSFEPDWGDQPAFGSASATGGGSGGGEAAAAPATTPAATSAGANVAPAAAGAAAATAAAAARQQQAQRVVQAKAAAAQQLHGHGSSTLPSSAAGAAPPALTTRASDSGAAPQAAHHARSNHAGGPHQAQPQPPQPQRGNHPQAPRQWQRPPSTTDSPGAGAATATSAGSAPLASSGSSGPLLATVASGSTQPLQRSGATRVHSQQPASHSIVPNDLEDGTPGADGVADGGGGVGVRAGGGGGGAGDGVGGAGLQGAGVSASLAALGLAGREASSSNLEADALRVQVKALLVTQTQLVSRVKTLEEVIISMQQQMSALHEAVHGETAQQQQRQRQGSTSAPANSHSNTTKLVSVDSDDQESLRSSRGRGKGGWQGGFGGDAAFPSPS